MKTRIFIVTKYIAAESLVDAMRKEKRHAPYAIFMDDCSVKALGDELVETNKRLSTRSRPMKKNARAVH